MRVNHPPFDKAINQLDRQERSNFFIEDIAIHNQDSDSIEQEFLSILLKYLEYCWSVRPLRSVPARQD